MISEKMLKKLEYMIDECPTYCDAICRWLTDDKAPVSDLDKLQEHYSKDDLEWLADYNN